MAWKSTATAVMAVALAVAPGAANAAPEGLRGRGGVSGEVRVQVAPAPYAALNGEGEGTAQLVVQERTDAEGATEGDRARFRARVRLGAHRLELALNEVGSPAGEASGEECRAAEGAAGGVAVNGFWSGPITDDQGWGTRRADILVWGPATVTLDGRELTDAARLELAAFGPSAEGASARDDGRLQVVVREVPELDVIRMRFPEGLRLEFEQPERRGEGQAVAARQDAPEGEEAPVEVLRDADALIPEQGPIPEEELEEYVVVGTVPGPVVIEIEVDEPPLAEPGTGGSGPEGRSTEGAAPAGDLAADDATGGSGVAPGAPRDERTGTAPQDRELERRADEATGGSGVQEPGTAAEQRPDARGSDGGQGMAPVGPDADLRLPEESGGTGSPELPAGRAPADAIQRDLDGRITGIPASNARTDRERVEVLQQSPPPGDGSTDTVGGVEPLNSDPVPEETRVLSPGIEPLASDVSPSSTDLPPATEVNDGVLPSTVTFGPGAGGGSRFGPGIGGGATAQELETQRQQEQAQGVVRPLGTLEDVPEMPAPIQPLNSSPASSLPQGIQPMNAQPAAPAR